MKPGMTNITRSTRLAMTVLVGAGLLVNAPGCSRNEPPVQGNQAAAVQAGQAARDASTTPSASGTADAAARAGTTQPSAAADPQKPVSRFHPAAMERPYEYIAQVWTTDAEREIVDSLSKPFTAEKAFQIIKKNPRQFLPLLHRAVRAENGEVRMQAVIILGLLKRDNNQESYDVLQDALLLDAKPEVRAIAAKAFVVLKSRSAVEALIRSLDEDPYEGARANSAWALGTIGNPQAIPHLRKATRDQDTFVRLRAVSALMKLRARLAVPELIERLGDENPMVRERAHQALRQITGTDKGTDPAEWRKVYGRPVGENADGTASGGGSAVGSNPAGQ